MSSHRLIVVTGQTATGKSAFAHSIAKKIGGEIINADARHIYQGLSIISGKDIGNTTFKAYENKNGYAIGTYLLDTIPIWLMDIIPVEQVFTSYEYGQLALSVIQDIWKRGKTPVVVGGTYLYIHHLLYATDNHIEPNYALRQSLGKKSVVELQEILKAHFPSVLNALNSSDRQNPHRLIRKIEMGNTATTTFPNFSLRPELSTANIEFIGIRHINQEEAAKRIQQRVQYRIKHGAVSEMKNFTNQNIPRTSPGLKTIGCLQIMKYIQGTLSKSEMEKVWTVKETQYAKRQLTIMKKNKHIQWRFALAQTAIM